MKLHRYVDHQRLHIVTKEVISLSISVLLLFRHYISHKIPGRVAQLVTCLATDACPTADPGVASSIPVRSHTFVEIDSPPFG